MEKIALITDSAADLNEDIFKKYNIFKLPLRIIYKDKEYIDRVNITPKEVYDRLSIEIPHTSLPSMEDMNNLFSEIESKGYTHALVVCLSSGLSGTYGAVKLISEQHPDLNTYVYDSKTLSVGTGVIVLEAAKMIQDGKSFKEIIDALPDVRSRVHLYYTLDTLKYLIKGGRIGKVAGTVGEILNIKPIISVNDDGIYYTYAKARGKKQALSKLVETAKNILKTSKAKVFVAGGGAEAEAKNVFDKLKDNPNATYLHFGDISPALGVHTGPGLVGVCIYTEE